MLCLVALLAAPPAPVEHAITGALVINPAGLYVRYDASFPIDGGLSLGVFNNWQVFGNGVGGQVSWRTDPAWFETHLDVSAEPGFYLKQAAGARIGAELDPGVEDGDRTFGWRYNATWQTNLNIRTGAWWLYSRSTAVMRLRDFIGADVFQRMQIEDEYSLEQATALLFRVIDWGDGRLWAYGEYTIGGVLDVGTRPNRPSAGVIVEGWPAKGASLNFDGFYSLAPGSLAGPGFITAWWFRW